MEEKAPDKKSKKGRPRYEISDISTVWLASIPVLTGIVIGVIWSRIPNSYFSSQSYEILNRIVASLVFFIWGITGIIVIIRKEFPQIIIIRGTAAVIYGIILLLLCWSLAIIIMIGLIQNYLY